MRKCFLCGSTQWIERHHVFGGAMEMQVPQNEAPATPQTVPQNNLIVDGKLTEEGKEIIGRLNANKPENKVNQTLDSTKNAAYTQDSEGGADDDFRRIQEASRGMAAEELEAFHSGSKELDEGLRGRLSTVFRRRLGSAGSGNGNITQLVNPKTNENVSVVSDVDAETFHDIFEIAQKYLKNVMLLTFTIPKISGKKQMVKKMEQMLEYVNNEEERRAIERCVHELKQM